MTNVCRVPQVRQMPVKIVGPVVWSDDALDRAACARRGLAGFARLGIQLSADSPHMAQSIYQPVANVAVTVQPRRRRLLHNHSSMVCEPCGAGPQPASSLATTLATAGQFDPFFDSSLAMKVAIKLSDMRSRLASASSGGRNDLPRPDAGAALFPAKETRPPCGGALRSIVRRGSSSMS
jgi:hypothetical protein